MYQGQGHKSQKAVIF